MGEGLCERCRDVVRSINFEDRNVAARKLEHLLTEVSGSSVAEHRLLLVMAEILYEIAAMVPKPTPGPLGHDIQIVYTQSPHMQRLVEAMNPLLPESERR